MKTALIAAMAACTALIGCSSGPDMNADGSFATTPSNISVLAIHCETNQIKPLLKDPSSFRKLDHSFTASNQHIRVTVNYTATNGFGGRIRTTKTCQYAR